MKTTTALNAFHVAALALTLGLCSAAQASDFDEGYPDFEAVKMARAKTATVTAATAVAVVQTRQPAERIAGDDSQSMTREDSGLFWLIRQHTDPRSQTLVARGGQR